MYSRNSSPPSAGTLILKREPQCPSGHRMIVYGRTPIRAESAEGGLPVKARTLQTVATLCTLAYRYQRLPTIYLLCYDACTDSRSDRPDPIGGPRHWRIARRVCAVCRTSGNVCRSRAGRRCGDGAMRPHDYPRGSGTPRRRHRLVHGAPTGCRPWGDCVQLEWLVGSGTSTCTTLGRGIGRDACGGLGFCTRPRSRSARRCRPARGIVVAQSPKGETGDRGCRGS